MPKESEKGAGNLNCLFWISNEQSGRLDEIHKRGLADDTIQTSYCDLPSAHPNPVNPANPV